ncbi:MAG TPA: hypothetical protein VNC60_02595 [Actinomycetota bacterium]|nr:hypothetical protein [Actinomycetota bacterium]
MAITTERIERFGEAALTGWRGAAGRAIARPVARHSRFSERQIEGMIGLALIGYAVYRLVRPFIRAARDER